MSADHSSTDLDAVYPFLSELVAMRHRTRQHIKSVDGDAGCGSDRPAVLRLLNEALATERARVARYRNHAQLGALLEPARSEFLKYAEEEQSHAERLAERILQLGGQPCASSAESSTDATPAERELDAEEIVDLLEEDLIAERIAIDCYREIMQFIGDSDAGTQQLLAAILMMETNHARELAALRAELQRRDRLSGSTSVALQRLDLQCA